jgi:predicted nucleic acid-binding protein
VVLVDTTVWINWLRNSQDSAVLSLDKLLEEGDAVLAPVILQEILQGAASAAALITLREQFEALPMLLPNAATYAEAGSLYARCRWQGITPRSPHDCLIARLAFENKVPLLHDDRNFEYIASIEPGLLVWRDLPG